MFENSFCGKIPTKHVSSSTRTNEGTERTGTVAEVVKGETAYVKGEFSGKCATKIIWNSHKHISTLTKSTKIMRVSREIY